MNNFISWQMQFISNAADKTYLIPIFGIVSILYLLAHGNKREVLMLLLASLSVGFSAILKLIFRQERPAGAKVSNIFGFDTYSFPSSHTLAYTVFWGFILYLCFKLTALPLSMRVIVGCVSVYFISLVGVSRIYLGQHYVWDVIAGYIFGALYLIILLLIDKRL